VTGSRARVAVAPSSARGGGLPSSARGGGPCTRSPRGERALMPVRRQPATATAREGGGHARLRPTRRCLILGPHVGGRLLRPDARCSSDLYSLEPIITYNPQERIPLESGSRNEKWARFKPEPPIEA